MIQPADLIFQLFILVDSFCGELPRHTQSKLYPSEIVLLALLRRLKNMSIRRLRIWALCTGLFPNLPDFSRLQRLFEQVRHVLKSMGKSLTPRRWLVVDSKLCEAIHPVREGRHPSAWKAKNKSKGRWMVGPKVAILLDDRGHLVNWEIQPGNAHDTWFNALFHEVGQSETVLADGGFKSAQDHPDWLSICKRAEHNERMIVESAFSQLSRLTAFAFPRVRTAKGLEAFYASILALYQLLMELNDRLGIDYKHPKIAHYFIL
jgi:Transposase DDE domain